MNVCITGSHFNVIIVISYKLGVCISDTFITKLLEVTVNYIKILGNCIFQLFSCFE